ncbi:MAG: AAA family ATPase [Anaerolineales bacterium]|nr:AAA family ATPase [Anaerolineales bacterium]
MYFKNIKIHNYKCFHKPSEIPFSFGFNVIVGKNNAGKTALVEALSLGFNNRQHRSIKTVPYYGASTQPKSTISFICAIKMDELRKIIVDKSPSFYLYQILNADKQSQERHLQSIFTQNYIELECEYSPSDGFKKVFIREWGNHQSSQLIEFTLHRDEDKPKCTAANLATKNKNLLPNILAPIFKERIYTFRAERFNVGQSEISNDPILKSDASNLAQVLHLLQTSNPSRFMNWMNLVRTIFPEIKQITVPPIDNSKTARISLWEIEAESERTDLSFPLQESGTGLGQVMAILYIAVTSEFPRTIIIDEPQSFLHPGAIRKLFSILQQSFSNHQYIITTHSPLVISSAKPSNTILIRKNDAESQIEIIENNEREELNLVLAEIGSRLSDVFGADNILWVEGQTEELCFPLLISRVMNRPLLGTTIVGVLQVGDFEGRHSKTIFEIYKRLCEGKGLLPPAIGFIFDREGRNQQERDDLERQSSGLVLFTKRRMYENYLLNPDAIAQLMTELEDFSEDPITKDDVENWIEINMWDDKYFEQKFSDEQRNKDAWGREVHGAKLLQDMFKDLSGHRYTYNKIEHGKLLTSFIIKIAPEEFDDIVQMLGSVLDTPE